MTSTAFPAVPRGAVAALAVLSLVLLGAGVALHGSGLEREGMLRLHADAPGAFATVAWSCLTIAGLGWSALILVLAADRGRGQVAALLALTFVLGSLLTHAPKRLLASPRPAGTDILPKLHVIGDVFSGSVSMPSGHSLAAAAAAALLWLALPRRWALAGAVPLLLFAGLVGLSRAAVGAHWPSDVLVGLGLGLLSAWIALRLALAARSRRAWDRVVRAIGSRTGQRVVALLEVGAAAGVLHERTGYPAGQPMVLLLATLALLSAAWRWFAARHRTASPSATTAESA